MNNEDLCFTPATELAKKIRNRSLSPVEVIDTVLARIETLEPELNAFATLTADAAREAAREAEAALVRGDATGPLHGVPVTIKDLTETAGIPTEHGHTRQDDDLGVRLEGGKPQPADGRDLQSLETRLQRRGILGGCRGRGCCGVRAFASRI
jgi:hypothetical protein